MELSARHINEKQFHDQWRGYSQEEVDDFLDRVADAVDALEHENRSLKSRLHELDQLVETSRSTESMLKKTLVTAQQAAEEAIAAAKTKAEQLIGEAEVRAERANEELKQRVATAEDEVRRRTIEAERQQEEKRKDLDASIERLKSYEADLKKRLSAFFEQQLKFVQSLNEDMSRSAEVKPQTAPAQTQTQAQTPAQRVDTPAPSGQDAQPETVILHSEGDTEDGLQDFSPVDDGAKRRVRRGLFRRDAREEEEWSQQA